MKRRPQFTSIFILMAIVSLPIAGSWMRHTAGDCCAMEGGALDELSQVRMVEGNGQCAVCCCIRCAELWRDRHGSASLQILVRDEILGQEISAQQAYFVRSPVVTNRMTGNRIHVFADEADAIRHTREFHGKLLTGAQRPLQNKSANIASN